MSRISLFRDPTEHGSGRNPMVSFLGQKWQLIWVPKSSKFPLGAWIDAYAFEESGPPANYKVSNFVKIRFSAAPTYWDSHVLNVLAGVQQKPTRLIDPLWVSFCQLAHIMKAAPAWGGENET